MKVSVLKVSKISLRKTCEARTNPGFRKGKAPINLVKNYVNPSYLQEMLIDEIVDDVLRSVGSELDPQSTRFT